MKTLSIIMPMYKEKDIGKNLKLTLKTLNSFHIDYEIIVVDDGSGKEWRSRAEAIRSSNVKVVGYDKNGGKGNAIKYGFRFCTGKYIAFLDADLELDPAHLRIFFELLKYADIVIGSKRHPLSKISYPPHRRFLSCCYSMLNYILFRIRISDTQAGIKIFKREVLEEIFPKLLIKRYAFDLELLVNAYRKGYSIMEAPIKLDFKRLNSRLGFSTVFPMLRDTLAIFYRTYIIRYYDS